MVMSPAVAGDGQQSLDQIIDHLHEPPQPAAQQLGGGRLQRLWLARGGAGGGKVSGNAERRLRRLAALKVNDGAAEQPMLEGESAKESRL